MPIIKVDIPFSPNGEQVEPLYGDILLAGEHININGVDLLVTVHGAGTSGAESDGVYGVGDVVSTEDASGNRTSYIGITDGRLNDLKKTAKRIDDGTQDFLLDDHRRNALGIAYRRSIKLLNLEDSAVLKKTIQERGQSLLPRIRIRSRR